MVGVPRNPNVVLPDDDYWSALGNAFLRDIGRIPQTFVAPAQALDRLGQALSGQRGYGLEADPKTGEIHQGQMMDDASLLAGLVTSAPGAPSAALGMGMKSLPAIHAKAKASGVKLWASEGPETIVLSQIVVPDALRNKGVGSAIMKELAAYADEAGKPIALTPTSDFGGSTSRLREFYKRIGFVDNKGRNKDFSTRETMIRPPASAAARKPKLST